MSHFWWGRNVLAYAIFNDTNIGNHNKKNTEASIKNMLNTIGLSMKNCKIANCNIDLISYN